MEGLQSVRWIHVGAGDKCEEERMAERNRYGLTTVSHLHTLYHLGRGGRGAGNEGVKLSLEES